jgi:hypothetical protein
MTARFGVAKTFTFSGYDYQGPLQHGAMCIGICSRKATLILRKATKKPFGISHRILPSKVVTILDVSTSGGIFVFDRWWGPIPWQAKDVSGKSIG